MKKISLILIIIVVMALGLSFSGCSSSAPVQRLLSDASPWLHSSPYVETSDFDVTRKDAQGNVVDNGKYVVIVEKFVNSDVVVGEETLTNFSGYVATSNLAMNNGDTQYSKVAFSTNIELKASYFESVIDGATTKQQASNDSKKYTYKTSTGGEYSKEQTVKHKKFDSAPYIEKTMLYLITRCLPNNNGNFSFSVIDTTKNGLKSVTTTRTANTLEDISFNGGLVACRAFNLSENVDSPGKGTPYKCYLATKKIDGTTILEDSDLSLKGNKNAIIKIVENNMEYVLTSITNTK